MAHEAVGLNVLAWNIEGAFGPSGQTAASHIQDRDILIVNSVFESTATPPDIAIFPQAYDAGQAGKSDQVGKHLISLGYDVAPYPTPDEDLRMDTQGMFVAVKESLQLGHSHVDIFAGINALRSTVYLMPGAREIEIISVQLDSHFAAKRARAASGIARNRLIGYPTVVAGTLNMTAEEDAMGIFTNAEMFDADALHRPTVLEPGVADGSLQTQADRIMHSRHLRVESFDLRFTPELSKHAALMVRLVLIAP